MSSPFSFSNSIASVSGDLAPQDAAWFRKIMSDCILCPRACHADRLDGGVGYCGQTADIMAARASLHYWEEPCISGTSGSGTVFFSWMQSCAVSSARTITSLWGKPGRVITPEHLVKIFLQLQEQGANNINLVTPTHFLPQIVIALQRPKIGTVHPHCIQYRQLRISGRLTPSGGSGGYLSAGSEIFFSGAFCCVFACPGLF